MDEEHAQDYADLSQGSYERLSKTKEIAAAHDYSVVDEHTDTSKTRGHTLYKKGDGSLVLTFRGTSVKRSKLKDLLTDTQLALGLIPKELRDAKRTAQTIRLANPDAKITLAGHSLGGTKALYSGKALGLQSVTHNPYVPATLKRGLKSYFKKTDSVAHVHMDDIVGSSAVDHVPHEQIVVYSHKTKGHPHYIKGFGGRSGVRLAAKKS